MTDLPKEYVQDQLTVVWKQKLCIHSAICVKGLGEVFSPNRRPWIDLSKAEKQAIMNQVDQCPSGALSYVLKNEDKIEETNKVSDGVEVEVLPNGPLAVKSNCHIKLVDGSLMVQEKASYFCRCGASSNKPFCDGSHKKIEFNG